MNITKLKAKFNQKTMMLVFGVLGLFLLATGISWAVFSLLSKGPSKSPTPGQLTGTRSRINLDLPKDAECLINGGKFTKPEKAIWDARRPLAIMIENHADSRPPSGLSRADVVYEAVAEGGITRFLGIFYCGTAAEDIKVAPVRSARIYFINWASEYGEYPIFMHVGGANNFSGSGDTAKDVRALETLETLGWRVPKGNDFDTTYDSGFPVFWRNYERLDHEVATEHTMMISTDAAYEEAAKRGFAAKDDKGKLWSDKFVTWKFIDGKTVSSPNATTVSYEFWRNKPDYNVDWKYDATTNSYKRFHGEQAHTDLEYDNAQLVASNVVVMYVKERGPVDRNLHMAYTNIGTGKAQIFQNGTVIEGTWEKEERTDRTVFFDAKGKEVSMVRGVTWISAIPVGNSVEYN
jgi:hypothetical protein